MCQIQDLQQFHKSCMSAHRAIDFDQIISNTNISYLNRMLISCFMHEQAPSKSRKCSTNQQPCTTSSMQRITKVIDHITNF